MDFLSLEHKSIQNLAPNLSFQLNLHNFPPQTLHSSNMHFDSSEPSGMLFFSMSISYQFFYPPESYPDPSRSDGTLASVQPSKTQSIFYFKSCLQSLGLRSLWGGSVLEAYSLYLSAPMSCQMGWEGARGLGYGHGRTRTSWLIQDPALLVLGGLSSLKWKKVCPGIGTDATQGEMGDHQDSGSFFDADNPFLHLPSSPPPPIKFFWMQTTRKLKTPTTDKELRDWGPEAGS